MNVNETQSHCDKDKATVMILKQSEDFAFLHPFSVGNTLSLQGQTWLKK